MAARMIAMTRQDLAPRSPCVCNTLRMVTRAVTQLYDDVLRPSGLRVTQFSILATIARKGETNLKQLEEALAIDQTTLTRSVNVLEREGVIERATHLDGRIKAMRLTAKGRRALGRPLRSGIGGERVVKRYAGTACHSRMSPSGGRRAARGLIRATKITPPECRWRARA